MNSSTISAELTDLLGIAGLSCALQPIWNLRTARISGFEALLRGHDSEGGRVGPAVIFGRAAAANRLLELERAARDAALSAFSAAPVPEHAMLFLNFSAQLLDRGQLDPGRIAADAERAGVPAERVALEIVESEVGDRARLAEFAERNRASGFLITLDDFGTDHSNLERVAGVHPDIIKIDRSIVHGAADDSLHRSVVRSVAFLARSIGALTLAEGVERYEDLLACTVEGVELAQGFLLGGPIDRKDMDDETTESESTRGHLARLKRDLSERLSEGAAELQAAEAAVDALASTLTETPLEELETHLRDAMPVGGAFECAYVVDRSGTQVTDTVMHGTQARRHALFAPARTGTDHSMKDYVYGPLSLARTQYVTTPYVSLATGTVCRTHARTFRSSDGVALLLCVDVSHDQA